MDMNNMSDIRDTAERLSAIDAAEDPTSVATYRTVGSVILDACLPGDGPLDTARLSAVANELHAAGYTRTVEDIVLCVQVALHYRVLPEELVSLIDLDAHRMVAKLSDPNAKLALAFEFVGCDLTLMASAAAATSTVDFDAGAKLLVGTLLGRNPTSVDELVLLVLTLRALVRQLVPDQEDVGITSANLIPAMVDPSRYMKGGVFDIEVSREQGWIIYQTLVDAALRLEILRNFAADMWGLEGRRSLPPAG